MRAAVLSEFGAPIEITSNWPDPEPPEGGVVIKVRATGVCRSDWHGWQGHDPDIRTLPHVLGHEFAGEIAAVGGGVSAWQTGDRVTAPFVCGCGTCAQCASGNAQVCPNQYQPGFSGPGSFAEFVAVPQAETNLVRLPEGVAYSATASLGCRFATAFRGLLHADQANLQAGESVAIFGCGGVGLSAVMLAKSVGAEVTAIDIRPSALTAAKGLGADHVAGPDEISGLEVDVAVDALGKTETCLAAINALKPRGRHVQIGLMVNDDATPPIPMGRVISKELKLIGSHGMAAAAYPEMLARLDSGALDPEKLIAKRVGLEDIPAELDAMGTFASESGMTVVEFL